MAGYFPPSSLDRREFIDKGEKEFTTKNRGLEDCLKNDQTLTCLRQDKGESQPYIRVLRKPEKAIKIDRGSSEERIDWYIPTQEIGWRFPCDAQPIV